MDPIPVSRYLVGDSPPAAPEGFTVVTSAVLAGLPHAIPIDQSTRLLVVVPTGLASTWRDLDPSTTISASDPEVQPFAPPAAPEPPGEATLLPARILLQSGNVTLATMPLVAGSRRLLPDSGTPGVGVRLEVYVVSWILTSGSIRGAGDFGSRVALAWRRADLAVDHFSTPPSQPTLVKRLPPQQKMESLVGYEIRAARLLDPHLRYRKQKVYIR